MVCRTMRPSGDATREIFGDRKVMERGTRALLTIARVAAFFALCHVVLYFVRGSVVGVVVALVLL